MSQQTDVILRSASAGDVPSLIELMDSVSLWLADNGLGQQWGETPFSQIPGFSDRLAVWVAQGALTVAVRDGRIVGAMALAASAPPLPGDIRVPKGAWFVHTVLSERGKEGRGIGAALLDRAERLAQEASAPAVALDHWAGNLRLGELYEARGYRDIGSYDDDLGGNRNTVRLLDLRGGE